MASIFHLVPVSDRPAPYTRITMPSSGGRYIHIVKNRGARRNCRGLPEPSEVWSRAPYKEGGDGESDFQKTMFFVCHGSEKVPIYFSGNI